MYIKRDNQSINIIFSSEMGKKKIIKTVLIIAGSVVVLFGLITLLVLFFWFYSPSPQMERMRYWSQFKKIEIENDTGKPVCVIINFRYTEEELGKYSIIIDNEYTNRIDTFPHFQYDESSIYLPIKVSDSTPFPKNFKVSILDSTCTSILRELDFDEFISLTKNEPVIKNNNPLTQEIWWLHIDSIINSKMFKYD